jgi:pimeloyl-ACP methyl ester carboxylesterase
VRIGYSESGDGPPLVILHGGWGSRIYLFDRQIVALSRHRIIAPDRTGYGGSGTLDAQPIDFHRRAAEETFAVLDALELERVSVWGHSDGAVIALWMAILRPRRLDRIVAEATHLLRRKPASREFFETMRDRPEAFGARVTSILAQEHGDRWRALLAANGEAWLRLGAASDDPHADLYAGRLAEARLPVLLLHGEADPRTEPGELDALRASLPHAELALLPGGGHSPHSERATAGVVTDRIRRFLSE